MNMLLFGRRPNPFTDLGCSIGDLVLYRRVLPASLLIDSGVTFTQMKVRYGLTPELMIFLKYSAEDWIRLNIEVEFALQLSNEQWMRIFGLMTRCELVAQLKRQGKDADTDECSNNRNTTINNNNHNNSSSSSC